jgi:ribonucleoside-diphosphate reductase alpha chain
MSDQIKSTKNRFDNLLQTLSEEDKSLPTEYQQFIHLSRYSRWEHKKKESSIPDKIKNILGLHEPTQGRRESWYETCLRYINFWRERGQLEDELAFTCLKAILNLEVLPSMRCLMTAGTALEKNNIAGFNCFYTAIGYGGKDIQIEHPELDEPVTLHLAKMQVFDEIMYILMNGTGVGFSVERQFINNLPKVGNKVSRRIYEPTDENYPRCDLSEVSTLSGNTIFVHDSKVGWSSAFRILIVELYNGNTDIKWDVSKVRKEGERLKTFGGRASGPKPLVDLFTFTVELLSKALNERRKLSSIECHSLVCKIASVIVVGGVRRSALISLSNLSDQRMRKAKSGNWWQENPHFALANNSVAYTEEPSMGQFMEEWQSLYESKSGERGIYNRVAANTLVPIRRKEKNGYIDYGCNPCSEITLQPGGQFCNLSTVIVRANDDLKVIAKKVRLAAILGTLQATLTDFNYISRNIGKLTADEALLGVSMTGIMDNKLLSDLADPHLPDRLQYLRDEAVLANKFFAKKLGINQATAVTCVKPEGTASQLSDTASGIHPRYAKYYVRTVRADKKDPLARMMFDMGVPCEDEARSPDTTWVFSFPIKGPDEGVFRDDRTAIEQLELWKTYQLNWCEHKPSITVYVKEDEWMEVGAWVKKNFSILSGVSFLPHSDHTYAQAPYQEITEEEYEKLLKEYPKIDWNMLSEYEIEDNTTSSHEMACTGGACDIT